MQVYLLHVERSRVLGLLTELHALPYGGQKLGTLTLDTIFVTVFGTSFGTSFGTISAFCFFGYYLSERFGRKIVINSAGQIVAPIVATLQSISNSYSLLFVGRLLVGIGYGTTKVGYPSSSVK
jgi:MFS family permease